MKLIVPSLIATVTFALGAPSVARTEAPDTSGLSIREVMESVITPATNTLWGVEDPQTDDEWRVLEDAAITTIAAGDLVARGGAGPNDAEWAARGEWQAFNDIMVTAASDALKAIRARDLDALLAANDVLYPPCESCHIAFNPGVE